MVCRVRRLAEPAAALTRYPMLLQGAWYFPLLFLAVAAFWCLPNRNWPRLAFLSSASVVVLAYLLWKSLDNRTVMALIGMFAAVSLASYFIGTRLARRRSQAWFGIGLAVPFIALAFTRCGSFGICPAPAGNLWLIPISVGFFALRQAHFVYECYRGGIKRAGLLEYLTYVFFFPAIIAGPLERFPRLVGQFRNKLGWTDLTEGAERIVIGCVKKFVIADLLIAAFLPPASVTQSAFQELSWGTALFACLMKFLHVYFDFSGYTDMAIGTARLFGIRLMENFNHPLLRSNLVEFWRAWHISLSTFARDYVYFPLLVSSRNTVLALIATMLAIASWHGTSPGWLLWGLHHGIGLALLAQFQRSAQKHPRLQRVRATLAWRSVATFATWTFVAYGYALTWHPDDIALSLRTYAKLWFLGIWP